jgi:Uma2 family endonuclease
VDGSLLAMTSTPSERSQRARMAAHILHSEYDSRELTRAGRVKFMARFADEVDPDRVLSEAERLRRAEHAREAYFTGLALKSARARRKRSGG